MQHDTLIVKKIEIVPAKTTQTGTLQPLFRRRKEESKDLQLF